MGESAKFIDNFFMPIIDSPKERIVPITGPAPQILTPPRPHPPIMPYIVTQINRPPLSSAEWNQLVEFTTSTETATASTEAVKTPLPQGLPFIPFFPVPMEPETSTTTTETILSTTVSPFPRQFFTLFLMPSQPSIFQSSEATIPQPPSIESHWSPNTMFPLPVPFILGYPFTPPSTSTTPPTTSAPSTVPPLPSYIIPLVVPFNGQLTSMPVTSTKTTGSSTDFSTIPPNPLSYWIPIPFFPNHPWNPGGVTTNEQTTTRAAVVEPTYPPFFPLFPFFPGQFPISSPSLIKKTTTKQKSTKKSTTTAMTTRKKSTTETTVMTVITTTSSPLTSTTTMETTKSQNTTNKLIVVDEENMHCFEVKGNCPGVERQWKELEEYMYRKHTTRYAKRYWNSTMTSNGRHSPRTTATPNVTTEFYYDYSEVDETVYFFGRCNVSVFSVYEQHVVRIMLYGSSGWIVLWVLLTIIVNFVYLQFGAHRFLDMYQELGFAIIYVFMGVFMLKPDNKALCTATTMILMFFLVFILSVGFMQSFWLSSIIRGTSVKNGRLPVLVNYAWPLMMSTLVMLVSYFSQTNFYASTRVHCFCQIFSSLYWTFTISSWVLWFLILIRNQLSITACRLNRPTVDAEQLYWAKKSCKGSPILIAWFLMTFYVLMYAVDMQLFWLSIAYTVLTVIFGPMLFFLHTHIYVATNNGLKQRTHLSVYRICAPKQRKLVAAGSQNHGPSDANAAASGGDALTAVGKSVIDALPPPIQEAVGQPTPPPPTNNNPPPAADDYHRPSSAPNQLPSVVPLVSSTTSVADLTPAPPVHSTSGPANAQQFYDWLTDRNEANIHESERILFRRPPPPPRPV